MRRGGQAEICIHWHPAPRGVASDDHWELGLFQTMHSQLAPLRQVENKHITHIYTEALIFLISAVALSHEVRTFINLASISPADLCHFC